jgi:RimJ/RimL family protein N-acetyltransferase
MPQRSSRKLPVSPLPTARTASLRGSVVSWCIPRPLPWIGGVPVCQSKAVSELRTERLLLRRWRLSDRAPSAALNADPEVVRYFQRPLTPSDHLADMADEDLKRQGWGLWALEQQATGRFIGFTGLARPTFEAPFTPAIEIGWRLARTAWGRGFATEAACAAVAFAFEELGLEELVSFTAEPNARSRAVMRRLGMRHDPADDFDHPNVPAGDLRRHVLYRLSASEWKRSL